jgi:hypothetical protein
MFCCVDAMKSEISNTVHEFTKEYFVGFIQLPVNSLVAPGSDIAHRGLDMKWVNKLAHSFKTTCQINEDIHVLFRTDVERPDGKVSLDDVEGTGASMEVIAGHHSIEAMKILHSTYPKNPMWSTPACKVYWCKNSSETRDGARSLGELNNLVKGLHRTPTKAEVCLQIHRQYLDEVMVLATPQLRKKRLLR